MYEIYINEHHFILTNEEERRNAVWTEKQDLLIAKYRTKKSLFQYIDMLEKSTENKSVLIWSKDLEALKKDFFSLYKVVPAGGGVVENSKGEWLFIFRNGVWDLPKGKMEKGESIAETAVREVQEETGLQKVELGKKIIETYHTYFNRKGKRCIKHSFWYYMKTKDQLLIPQAEEGIEKAVWIHPNEYETGNFEPIYANIVLVLNAAKSIKNS